MPYDVNDENIAATMNKIQTERKFSYILAQA